MKKLFIGMIVGVLVISCLGLIACGSSSSDSKNDMPTETKITVYNDENPVEFTVKYGETAQIRSFTKSGYYLEGYFTEKENGEKYFNTNGESIGVWQEGNPAVFYARWKSIDDIMYNGGTIAQDEPIIFGGFSTAQYCYYTLSADINNAVKGNLDKNIKANIKFKVLYKPDKIFTDSKNTLSISIHDSRETGAENYATKKVDVYVYPDGAYDTFSLDYIVSAKCIKQGEFNIFFNRGNTFGQLYLKEVTCSISFE